MGKARQIFWMSLFCAVIFLVDGWVELGHPQVKYPARAIDLVVPLPPGGSVDLTARVAAGFLNKKFGVPVNVINKPGGKTIPGCNEVFHANPNGYTMLADCSGTSSYLVIAEKNLPFDVMERTYIGVHSVVAYVLATPATSPFKTLGEFIKECKDNPQNITYASLAGTTPIELAIRQFFDAIGSDISKTKPVLVDGAADGIRLTAGGHVALGSAGVSGWLPSIKGGTIRPLLVTSKERNPLLPDVPTSAEVSLPTVTAINWFGISGPPKLPSHIIEAWESALKEMAKDPDTISKFKNIGAVTFYLDSQETKRSVLKDIEDLKKYWK